MKLISKWGGVLMYDLLKKEILNKYFLDNIKHIVMATDNIYLILSNKQKLIYKIDDLLEYIKKKEGLK